MASTSSRPKTPRRSLKRQKSGIFETVFSYVSQEMSNFVASATGAPKNEDEEGGESEYGSEEEGEVVYEERAEPLNDVTPAPKSRPKKMREEESSPSPPRKKVKSKAHRRSPSPDQLAFATSSSSAPRSILTRKPSKPTMPGSLIPFSPGSTAGDDDDDEPAKHVHFDGGSPETAVDLTGDPELTPRQPRAKSPQTPTRVKAAVERFTPTSDTSMLLPQHPISPSRSKGTPSPVRVDKGKAPAKPYDRTFRSDLSFDADAELKIKRLEAEVRQLREELARHGGAPPVQPERDISDTDFSFLAPAPPPPPPPPPPSTIFRVPKQSDNLDVVFTHVRAALRHKTPPKEKPINPAGPAGIATLGIAPDKMAAFLTELKTVKLKKTTERSFASDGDVSRLHSLTAHAKRVGERDRSFASEGDVSRFDTTFSLSRSRIGVGSGTGEKRKRLGDHDGVAGDPDRALKRTALSTSTRSTVSRGAGGSGSTSFDSTISSGVPARQPQSLSRSQSQAETSRTHTLVRDWREGTAAATSSTSGSMSSIPASTTSSAPTSASSADAPTPSLCSDQDADSHDNDDPAPTTPPPHISEDPHNISAKFRPPTPPLIRRSGDILPAEVHYEISLRPPPTETPIALRGEMSTIVGDDDGEEDMIEDTPMPAAISVGDKSVFAKRVPVSPLPDKSPRRPLPPGARRSLSRSSRDSAIPQPRMQVETQTPVTTNANSSFKSSKSARTAKGTPHPAKTMSGGSLPRRILALSEDEDEPATHAEAIPPTEAYNPDQTFNFDESSMNLSMSILGSREGPRRVPMRQALPRTDPAVAAAARRLALAHSIGRSKKRDDSGSERAASPAEERGGMADATFTLDDLRTQRETRESMSVGERRAERSGLLDEGLEMTARQTPRRPSPVKSAATRTITRRRSTLDQELRRSSIASSVAISATGNASFSMLTGEELPPGMLDDDDDTVNFLKRMGEGEGGRYDFEAGDDDDFAELEEHMYTGVGTRPKSGFLAHGGAGGPAVWTDV